MDQERLLVICDRCQQAIADGDGFLHVSMIQVMASQDDKVNPDAPALSLEALFGLPDTPRWQAHHTRCCPDVGDDDYDVPVAQVRTWPRLASTTARLMSKTWFASTDWAALLESAASGGGRRVTRGAMREAS
ncbi:hypothetical protein N5079_19655 [Planotetraspora sp. A-T 1434]|uniref:hypothetical protein n=1 Tax=Planotetraspora sp. A-T 1434 TaxID=2979219 RepID=UPI0021C0EC3C|nr:hypothetical protein [Planotetraspora sp. A-T 1434]MCT9932420.1 hypothetical protein [Planotetraspora sp. A-T 1434]